MTRGCPVTVRTRRIRKQSKREKKIQIHQSRSPRAIYPQGRK